MKVSAKDKNTFQKIVAFMEQMDGNGLYYTILEDLETVSTKELILEILDIFSRWKTDINKSSDPKYKTICNFEYELIAIL